MLKILAPVILVIIILTGFAFYKFLTPKAPATLDLPQNPVTSPHPSATPSPVGGYSRVVSPSLNKTPLPASASTNDRISTLESMISVLQKKVESLEKNSSVTQISTTTSTSTQKSPVYITLASGGSSNSSTYSYLSPYEIAIDTVDYSGYKNMQLEINMSVPEIVGSAYARLYNATDSKDIIGSEVNTASRDPIWLTSSSFSLTSGKKTYQLQIKSTESRLVNIQSARIKINF